MPEWLLNRLFEAKDQPEPRFAFQGTVNWMRALAILTGEPSFSDDELKSFYRHVQRRKQNYGADTTVFENMLLAFHHQACLERLTRSTDGAYDLCRASIISWYYSTYFTGKAMISAASGSSQETHAATARAWQADLVAPGLVVYPFSLSLESLIAEDAEKAIAGYRGSDTGDLKTTPRTISNARACVASYLGGTRDYEKGKLETRVRSSRDFKALGVRDFRKVAARRLRDDQLRKAVVNFLVQAFRYRGKANYRDSIFLSYGQDNSARMTTFVTDLSAVSRAFQQMAACYIARRVERGTWAAFLNDLRAHSRLSLRVDYLAEMT